MKPDFIDNRDGNTLAQALGSILDVNAGKGLSEAAEPPDQVRIATAFFSPTGFAQIADHLLSVPEVRLLLGADLAAVATEDRKRLDETPEMFERRRIGRPVVTNNQASVWRTLRQAGIDAPIPGYGRLLGLPGHEP